ncbi:hypothetical protein HPP92_010861 [Vanilla planifolia]|uniref:Uncharacterized protein n=1 Tax=Vanilla planifolia TaxID=51239 RepID=A0A835R4X6_VANPL|nr:hypothetical protein HPP92_010861 [Vanilla planifolia]
MFLRTSSWIFDSKESGRRASHLEWLTAQTGVSLKLDDGNFSEFVGRGPENWLEETLNLIEVGQVEGRDDAGEVVILCKEGDEAEILDNREEVA